MHDLAPVSREMRRLVEGVRDDQLGDPTPCPEYTLGGPGAAASAVGATALNELVVHGWDVARASGQPYVLDDASVTASREFVAAMSGPGSDAARVQHNGPPRTREAG